MKIARVLMFFGMLLSVFGTQVFSEEKIKKIVVVDSYHRSYLWSQETHKGFFKKMLEMGLFDDPSQVKDFIINREIKTKKAHFLSFWMNTKRKYDKTSIAKATKKISDEIREFGPDIMFLGDDNAANYLGNQFIDTSVPVVFWGVNGSPLKHNLIDSIEKPGHNVTGVYQAGYYAESLEFLNEIVPSIKSFAIISDDTATGRSKAKKIESLARTGKIKTKLIEPAIITNSFEEWKKEVLRLSKKTDAFFILNHQGLKTKSGNSVEMFEAGAWYLKNIKLPECSDEKQFVEEGLLATVDDSGFSQGYEAANLAQKFIEGTALPKNTSPLAPAPGPRVVNKARLKQLKISLQGLQVDEQVNESLALKAYP